MSEASTMDVPPEALTKHESQLIKDNWSKLTKNKNAIRKTFYTKIFELDPSTQALFRESFLDFDDLPDSWEFMYNSVDDLRSMIPEIMKLGLKHKTYKMKKKHYPLGREALSWTLKVHLGEDFTVDLNDAWTKLFDYMSYYMIAGMQKRKITL